MISPYILPPILGVIGIYCLWDMVNDKTMPIIMSTKVKVLVFAIGSFVILWLVMLAVNKPGLRWI